MSGFTKNKLYFANFIENVFQSFETSPLGLRNQDRRGATRMRTWMKYMRELQTFYYFFVCADIIPTGIQGGITSLV